MISLSLDFIRPTYRSILLFNITQSAVEMLPSRRGWAVNRSACLVSILRDQGRFRSGADMHINAGRFRRRQRNFLAPFNLVSRINRIVVAVVASCPSEVTSVLRAGDALDE